MFQPDHGFGPAKWLPWLFAAAVFYAVLQRQSRVPQHLVAKITTIAVAVIVRGILEENQKVAVFGRLNRGHSALALVIIN